MVTERRERLIVFTRSPRRGAVKTRLIPLLGADGAADLHAALLDHTLKTARAVGAEKLELHAAEIDDDLSARAERYGATLFQQCCGDLGERMQYAFTRALAVDRCSAVVLIGSDCAVLSELHLAHAFDALREGCDAVLGPAEDGGYVLIGLTRAAPEVFSGIDWGTSSVMTQTRVRLQRLGWTWHELETLWDIDRPDDYLRLARSGFMSSGLR
jgi:rSAM/selenodomain-associated transferase 1